MNILMTGSSGFIGSSLSATLSANGHRVVHLVRSERAIGSEWIHWEPASGVAPKLPDEAFEAVVHLAGENIAAGKWNKKRKRQILDSRVKGTQALCQALAGLSWPPCVLISASAIGYYGDRGDEWLCEESLPGTGFLVEVCRAWETATAPALEKGIRVVNLRMGLVLSPRGGALAKMLPACRAGLGAVIGTGRQYVSWIALDDVHRVIQHCIQTPALAGPVLAVTPHPVTQREFVKTLGSVLGRPAPFRLPSFLVRLLLGEMGSELFLASQRAEPARLTSSGYLFEYPHLEAALHHYLGA